jgi:hypothetical protein
MRRPGQARARPRWVLGRPTGLIAMLVLAAVALSACGASNARHGRVQRVRSAIARLPKGRPSHIAMILMENEEYSDIIGSHSTPYINALARRYAVPTGMYAITHPSLPNYLALTGGSTFGITSDCTDCSVASRGLVDQFEAAHVSWKAYMEDLPHPCFAGSGSGSYAKKHDPFIYFAGVVRDRSSCNRVVPLSQLGIDERRGTLPTFIWITPNLCHDMHDCGTNVGDRFLSGLVPQLLRSLGPRGLLVLTWDEGSSDQGCCRFAAGGHIATILAGPAARRGARLATPVDQYSILQTIEDLLGLSRLRGAACACTPSLQPLIRRSQSPG